MIGALLVIAVLLAGFGFMLAVAESMRWQKFSAEHSCHKVGTMSGDTFTTVGVGVDGKPTVSFGSTPDKTGWLCDDGMTYWK
jgi:hypothetical protein